MTDIRIDLYSDTITRPTPGMRQAISQAEVGNEQAKEDPTTYRLHEMVAELLGKEDAIYVPSGTMCNAIAYRVHCRQGDEVIAEKSCHTIISESGGPAALSGVMMNAIDGVRGMFSAAQLEAAIRPARHHNPRSRLVSVEQTSNRGGGSIWPLETLQSLTQTTRGHGLSMHMDGARLLNAAVETGVPASEYAATCDTVWVDFSKGLGAPVGAVLAGPKDFIEEAWRFKHQFGGAMRQSGIIAAACIYALENHVERLREDHENAQVFANTVAEIPGVKIDRAPVETNLVFIDVSGTGMSPQDIHERLLSKGVRIGVSAPTMMRAVTHLDVVRSEVEEAAGVFREVVTNGG